MFPTVFKTYEKRYKRTSQNNFFILQFVIDTGVKLTFFPVATWLLYILSGSQFQKVGGHYDTHTSNFYPVTELDRLNC